MVIEVFHNLWGDGLLGAGVLKLGFIFLVRFCSNLEFVGCSVCFAWVVWIVGGVGSAGGGWHVVARVTEHWFVFKFFGGCLGLLFHGKFTGGWQHVVFTSTLIAGLVILAAVASWVMVFGGLFLGCREAACVGAGLVVLFDCGCCRGTGSGFAAFHGCLTCRGFFDRCFGCLRDLCTL